ncbi:F-BAR domain only protein 2-like isoform X3 [Mercenaria mercenaria]|uniref:F-BAR domain only protein 2-like isoform X3 n=1 Tax=Mercenaria mercenaria TaxID=6596 RepID=UPI00234E4819|nr:F-BAR domain only protein 2-like isoform X3 [Mercenaria mercenaria]
MTTFAESFWGGKNNGFYVLYHNMKHGQTSTKDLIDFLRESCQVEETYSKLLTKLAKVAANSTHVGTFAPFWNILKTLAEKLASLHMQLVHTWSDLIKDIVRYNEDQHRRHKSMKEGESGTLEVVQSIQNTTTALHRAKEIYHTRCLELERLKRENASPKDVEKSETKYKKAKEEYKNLVEKYATIREDFQNKMVDSCTHFQELEEEHICQMKDFIDTYARAMQNEHVLFGQAQEEFRTSSDSLTVQKLLETFIEVKSTGKEKPAVYKGAPIVDPGPLEFVEPDLSSLPSARPMSPDTGSSEKRDSISDRSKADSSGSASPVPSDQPGPLSRSVKLRVSRTWFLKKRKEKKKKKKDKDDKDSESVDTQESGEASQNAPEVDEEGFSIRPTSADNNGDNKSWYSSDSDSDSDTDIAKKLKVQIKPLSPTGSQPSANVDDIRTSMGMLRLSPTVGRKGRTTPVDKKMMMKRSQSESDTLDVVTSKSGVDLLNIDIFASSASTPTGGYQLPSPLSPMSDGVFNSDTSAITSSPLSLSNTSDLLNQARLSGSDQPSVSPSHNVVENGVAPPLPQRPPSRNKGILPQVPARPSGRNSPFGLNRVDSGSSVTWNTTSMPVGSSRGPSPLTIGMADVVPLAVAFTETINAYFKGTDATKCSVKMTGNLMMSFPAGVVRVFMDNPNPAVLSFRLKNGSQLEQILLNKQLVSEDSSQSIDGSPVYTFDMQALGDHLRSQGETNKSASYFNIDILKYQMKALPGVESTPLPVVVYWKCEESCTDYRLDYRFNPGAMTSGATLKNISATVIVDGGVTSMQSIPEGNWNSETKRATWKLNDISEVSESGTHGSIRAKLTLSNGKSTPSTTAIQFLSEGATLSGIEFELVGSGYRISLSKKRFGAGKYLADPEQGLKYV